MGAIVIGRALGDEHRGLRGLIHRGLSVLLFGVSRVGDGLCTVECGWAPLLCFLLYKSVHFVIKNVDSCLGGIVECRVGSRGKHL